MKDPGYRDEATAALRKMGSVAEPSVLKSMNADDVEVRRNARDILAAIGTEQETMIRQSLRDLHSDHLRARTWAGEWLANGTPKKKLRPLVEPAGRTECGRRAEALDRYGEELEPALLDALKGSTDRVLRVCAIPILEKVGTEKSIPVLSEVGRDYDAYVKERAEKAISEIRKREAEPEE